MSNAEKLAEKITVHIAEMFNAESDGYIGKLDDTPPEELFTALLLADYYLFRTLTGNDGDIVDYTHILNKLAIGYVMDGASPETDGE